MGPYVIVRAQHGKNSVELVHTISPTPPHEPAKLISAISELILYDDSQSFGLWKNLCVLNDDFETFMEGVSRLPPRKEGLVLNPFCVEVQYVNEGREGSLKVAGTEMPKLKYQTIDITNLLEDTEIFDSPWKSNDELCFHTSKDKTIVLYSYTASGGFKTARGEQEKHAPGSRRRRRRRRQAPQHSVQRGKNDVRKMTLRQTVKRRDRDHAPVL